MQFKVTSGEVFITDPCYDRDTIKTCGIKTPAKNGNWLVSITEDDGRVAVLQAVHEDYAAEVFNFYESKLDSFCVDSGQAGIFDVSQYPTGDCGEYEDKSTFYGQVCDLTYSNTNRDQNHGVINFGCCSSSGYGDGVYSAYVRRSNNNEVVSIRIDFFETDGESDEN